jgi:hypothetical protein
MGQKCNQEYSAPLQKRLKNSNNFGNFFCCEYVEKAVSAHFFYAINAIFALKKGLIT